MEENKQELTAEEQEQYDEAKVEVKRLQDYLRPLVEKMFTDGFKMYALDTASDIFKSLCIIQGAKAKEWQDKVSAGRKIDEDFYNLNSSSLTYVEESAKTDTEVKE